MFEWFMTIPGILVICGVILLIIAIILLVVSSKKERKENKVATNNNDINTNVQQQVAPVTENLVTEQPVVKQTNITEEPSVVSGPIEINEPVIEQVQEAGPVVDTIVEQPVNEVINEPVTVINNDPVVFTTPVSDAVINIPAMEPVNNEVVSEPQVNNTVYGVEMPNTNFTVQEEKPVTIYGGNDPLEATQSLPIMEEHHIPYGGIYPEVKIVEPVIEQPVPTPVEEVVTAMPTFDFNIQPEVVNIPTQEVINIPSEPVNEPTVENIQPVSEPTIEIKPSVEEL